MKSKRNFSARQLDAFNAYLKALVSHVAKNGKVSFDAIRREHKTTGLTLKEYDLFELSKYEENIDAITREVSDSIRYALRDKQMTKKCAIVEEPVTSENEDLAPIDGKEGKPKLHKFDNMTTKNFPYVDFFNVDGDLYTRIRNNNRDKTPLHEIVMKCDKSNGTAKLSVVRRGFSSTVVDENKGIWLNFTQARYYIWLLVSSFSKIHYELNEELRKKDSVINGLEQEIKTLNSELAQATAVTTEIPPIVEEEPKKSWWNRFFNIAKK